LWWDHGITLADYEAMLARQGGGCATCGRKPESGKNLHVDHDHQTGKIRGLLCIGCNLAIGYLEHASRPVWEAYLAEHNVEAV
jgi:hypothetical protein